MKTRTTKWQKRTTLPRISRRLMSQMTAPKKEDDWKPAAVKKKMDDATLTMKDPPKRIDEGDQTDGKKPAAKENVQDKKKRRNP
jgi:hypothetical protein